MVTQPDAVLDRRSTTAQMEVLAKLHLYADHWRPIIDQRRGRMGHALRNAVLSNDAQLSKNACQAILWFREYDLLPTLVTAAENVASANADLAAETIEALADLLYEELAAPGAYGHRRDPQLLRGAMVTTLESSLKRFHKHSRSEVTRAFLEHAHRDNVVLKQILHDPHHSAYVTVVNTLQHEQRGGIIRLLLSFLDDPHAPSTALSLIAKRSDRKFLRYLLKKVGAEFHPPFTQNLHRIEQIPWLQGEQSLLLELDEAEQRSAIQLAIGSNIPRAAAFRTVEFLLTRGLPEGRRAAAKALEQFNGAEANNLALRALSDPDPRAQAIALAQLRPRGIPGALTHLIEMADSPHDVVRSAVRDSLQEFTLERFLGAYDILDEEVRRSTGRLVRKLNPDAVPAISHELQSKSRTRRLRGLAVATSMDLAAQLEAELIELMNDEDHLVRSEAAKALGECLTETALRVLRNAADNDRSPIVQEAAQESLANMEQRARRQSHGNQLDNERTNRSRSASREGQLP